MPRPHMIALTSATALALAACTTASDDGDTATASTQTTTTTTTTAPAAAPTPTPTPTPAPAPAPAASVTVGGAEMLPTSNIVENASKASNLTTLVQAATAAGLATTLSGPGPFTVFAPTNDAFARLAPGTVDNLLKPENKAALTKVLTYHVVAGKLDSEALKAQVEAGGGKAVLTTVAGDPLTATLENGALVLTDGSGNKSYVTQYDVEQSNGVVHVVNGVVVPTLP